MRGFSDNFLSLQPNTTRMTERIIAQRLGISLPQVQGTVRLLREGATIPFISRYRKEATGSLDELQVGAIKEQLDRLTELEARRQTVLATIEGQGKLTGELRKRIEECWDAVELEDIYLPYKPKRRTRATAARERGLEPLADIVMAQRAHDLLRQAQRFVTAEVATPEEAIAGACDIIAERISEDEQARNTVRRTMGREGAVHSKLVKGKEAEGAKYSDYFDAASPLRSIHRTGSWPCVAAKTRGSCASRSMPTRSASPKRSAAGSYVPDRLRAHIWRPPWPTRSSGSSDRR